MASKPFAVRVDNGLECDSGELMRWAETRGIALSHIQPGKPQQNAYVECCSRTVRQEWLDHYIIESIEEARFRHRWLWTQINEGPNAARRPNRKLKWLRESSYGAPLKTGELTFRCRKDTRRLLR